MLNRNTLIATSLIVFLLSLSSVKNNAHAQDSIWYGASFGDASTSESGFEDSSLASIYFGERFNDNFAYQLGHVDLGKFDVSGASDTFIEITGNELSGLGFIQVGESAELFGKVGFYFWDMDAVLSGADVGEEDGTSWLIGFGVKIPFGQTVGARLEWVNYIDIEDEDVDTLNLGFYFGDF